MIVAGEALNWKQFPQQRPKTALHPVADHGVADALGNGNAETQQPALIGAGEQDETGAGHAGPAISGKEVGALAQDDRLYACP